MWDNKEPEQRTLMDCEAFIEGDDKISAGLCLKGDDANFQFLVYPEQNSGQNLCVRFSNGLVDYEAYGFNIDEIIRFLKYAKGIKNG